MMKFHYRVFIQDSRKYETGEIEAHSREEAAQKLRMRNFTPVEIEPIVEKRLDLNRFNDWRSKVKVQELAFFTRQLSTMLKNGLTPLRALDVVGAGSKNELLIKTVNDVKLDLNQGAPMAAAMAKHPKVFDNIYLALVRAGESSGKLDKALDRLADNLDARAKLRRQIRGAMIYPMVVLTIAFVVFMSMMLFVVPAFEDIFAENGGELPLITKMLVAISDVVKKFWFLIPVLPPLGLFGIRKLLATKQGRQRWDALKLRLPLKIGTLTQLVVTARFFRTLSSSLESGVSIISAMEVATPTAGNVIVEEMLKDAASDIKRGDEIAASLRRCEIFPALAIAMLEVGEESGDIIGMLGRVADVYEFEVENSITTLKSIMEPVMIVLIGGVIGVTVIGLYMPIFKIYDTIK